MRFLQVALAALALVCMASNALAQDNSNTTFALHALDTAFGPCAIADPCPNPDVNATLGVQAFVYLIARNFEEISGVQTAFDFGGWTFTFGLWDCLPNQLSAVAPGAPGGPTSGTIATAFDCVVGGQSTVIGRMSFIPTAPTCVTQVPSTFPEANHVVDCAAAPTSVIEQNQGTVCAGTDGVNACESAIPVEATTWGGIKAQFN